MDPKWKQFTNGQIDVTLEKKTTEEESINYYRMNQDNSYSL